MIDIKNYSKTGKPETAGKTKLRALLLGECTWKLIASEFLTISESVRCIPMFTLGLSEIRDFYFSIRSSFERDSDTADLHRRKEAHLGAITRSVKNAELARLLSKPKKPGNVISRLLATAV